MQTLALYRNWLRRLTWGKLLRRLRRIFVHSYEKHIYYMTPETALSLPASSIMSRDRVEDLELWRPMDPGQSRSEMLKEWKHRLQLGHHVYTYADKGVLICYGWMIERQKLSKVLEGLQTLELPDNCAVTYDFYTDPEYRQSDYYQSALIESFQDAARLPSTYRIYLSVHSDVKTARWWVERLG